MTLNGFDIYSGTPEADVVKALAADFVIVKATEGGTYVNPKHDEHVQRTRTAGRLVGHYHYAHPESNGPDTEARAFLRAVKALPGEVLVLDFEPAQILPVYPAWVIGFADVVTSVTGAPCWLYTNQAQGRALMSLATPQQRTQLALMPLWKAYYQMAVGDLMGWPSWACWQYTSSPMDANFFNGDAARWRALGVPGGSVPHVRTTWRGVATCTRGAAAFEAACRLHPQGDQIQATQGSYTTAVPGSGGTHSGCGVVDVARFRKDGREWTWAELVSIANVMRQTGCFAWPREALAGTWPRHVHTGATGCPELSVEAVYQVRDYKAGKDGLLPRSATTGISLTDDTPGCTRAYVDVTWESYQRQNGFLMALTDDQQTDLYTRVQNIEKQGQAKDAGGTSLGFDWLPAINNNVVGLIGLVKALSETLAKLAAGADVTAADIEAWIKAGIADSVKVTGTLEVEPRDVPVP